MTNYILRNCPRCKKKLTIQVVKPVSGNMMHTVRGHCESCGHHFDWVLLRGKALLQQTDKLTAYG